MAPGSTDTSTPTVLLVPGLWHGGWAWAKLQDRLGDRGIPTRAVTFPGEDRLAGDPTFDGHVAHLRAEIARAPRPLVVVAHSYGGAVVSEAVDAADVARMVFVAAFPLEVGESIADVVDGKDAGDAAVDAGNIDVEDGLLQLDRETALSGFYQDCDLEEAEAAIRQLTPEHPSTRSARVKAASWRAIPSHYVVTLHDRAIRLDVQRLLAARLTSWSEIDSGHSPMLSRTGELADVIEKAVQSVVVAV